MLCASMPTDTLTNLAPLPAVPSLAPERRHVASSQPLTRQWAWATLVLALAFVLWEAAGGDRWLADMAGNAAGFAWRNHWLLEKLMHAGGRLLAWALALALCLGVWWPVGPLRLLTLPRRLQLAGGVLLSVAVVALLKSTNPADCPWNLVPYGGVAEPVSHWLWWVTPVGGRGSCFPAGHASAGFAFIGGYFVFRPVAPALARRWLVATVMAGLLLGVSQQWRGAHFMSHTLWSGWLCWCLAWALDAACSRAQRTPPATVVGL
jgi:membrane-associated PAP2 superfamily phosphatase